jgi:hypothetical protein
MCAEHVGISKSVKEEAGLQPKLSKETIKRQITWHNRISTNIFK